MDTFFIAHTLLCTLELPFVIWHVVAHFGGNVTWLADVIKKWMRRKGGGSYEGEWKNGHLPPPPLLMEKIAKYFCQKNGQNQGP